MKIGCVVLAAGLSSRFGGNKLLADYGDRNLADLALKAVPVNMLEKVVVVTRYPEIRKQAEDIGFLVVWNEDPERGISWTVRLGLEKMDEMDAVLFMVCDQPKLTRKSVAMVVDSYIKNPGRIVCASSSAFRGNPCVFPSKYYKELRELTGDSGGSAVIRQHKDALLLVKLTDAAELKDVDRVSDLDMLNN